MIVTYFNWWNIQNGILPLQYTIQRGFIQPYYCRCSSNSLATLQLAVAHTNTVIFRKQGLPPDMGWVLFKVKVYDILKCSMQLWDAVSKVYRQVVPTICTVMSKHTTTIVKLRLWLTSISHAEATAQLTWGSNVLRVSVPYLSLQFTLTNQWTI